MEKVGAVPVLSVRDRVAFDHFSFSNEDTQGEAPRDVSFEVCPGQKVAVLGAPGSGMSTATHFLSCFGRTASGWVAGLELLERGLADCRSGFGLVEVD